MNKKYLFRLIVATIWTFLLIPSVFAAGIELEEIPGNFF